MLSPDVNGQDGKASCANGLVAQDVLLSKGMASPGALPPRQQPARSRNVIFHTNRSADLEEGEIPVYGPFSGPTIIDTSPSATNNASPPSGKEEERRQKMRERKRIQRLNQDFAERERLRARGRIKALREDPLFRQNERQRDKERRRKSRLINQSQRVQERERDKIHKSLIRSFVGDLNSNNNDHANTNTVPNQEPVDDSNNFGANSEANVASV